MKKLITGAIVAAALAVLATPAFAIHHLACPELRGWVHRPEPWALPCASANRPGRATDRARELV